MSATISTISRRFHGRLASVALHGDLADEPHGLWSTSAVAAMANETIAHRRHVHQRRRVPERVLAAAAPVRDEDERTDEQKQADYQRRRRDWSEQFFAPDANTEMGRDEDGR